MTASRHDRPRYLLLTIAESLVCAHIAAKREGDGATIDIVQDALVHVGRRLATETASDSPSARRILGRFA